MLNVEYEKLKSRHGHLGDLMSPISAARFPDRLAEILNLVVVQFEECLLGVEQLLVDQGRRCAVREPDLLQDPDYFVFPRLSPDLSLGVGVVDAVLRLSINGPGHGTAVGCRFVSITVSG